ncbi:MAG TPA: hypothetical protein VKR32_17750 [Puia sp.]|nr:hypothetical protein [Puia sp.]
MDLLLIVLDDWEGLIQASACWGHLTIKSKFGSSTALSTKI